MGYARSRLLLPDIFPLYRQRYPNVDLRVVIDSAKYLGKDADERRD
jgi:DNA-binding transcriptional LysR family regulator